MIATKIKTHPAAADKVWPGLTRLHWIMTVVGIVTAIACSLVLLKEIQPSEEEIRQSGFTNAPGISTVEQTFRGTAALSAFSILANF